jgi:hypothetical protein
MGIEAIVGILLMSANLEAAEMAILDTAMLPIRRSRHPAYSRQVSCNRLLGC